MRNAQGTQDAQNVRGECGSRDVQSARDVTTPQDTPSTQNAQKLGFVLAIYLVGLAVGGLYVGMVAPVRTVIQAHFGLDDATGIWMINIYTLFYAALIPVIGKLADRYGRKPIFVLCVTFFGLGAALCGLSRWCGGFVLLLAGRVAQAVGACGMIPVANAEIGTSFPAEKRGMALGLAAAVAGLANVLGAAVGSLILGVIGNENWPWLFFGCIPLCILLLVGGMLFLQSTKRASAGRLDIAGSVFFVAAILFLLLGIRNLDFLNLAGTVTAVSCWGPLVGAVLCIVIFRFIERRAEDPIFHMEYLHVRPIFITMAVSFFIGCAMISMTIVPEFAEAVMDARTGSGGYYVAALSVFSLVGPVVAGKLIDRGGPKRVLIAGLALMVVGFAFLGTVAIAYPSALTLIAGLSVVGLGMGFSMGAPTNYMILQNVPSEESTSAVATIALVRQIGTSIAPAIYVGFISNAAGLGGYQQMMAAVAICCACGIALMLFYREPQGKR